LLRRSPTSSSSSPPNELSHGGRNHRHRRGFLAGNRAALPPNSPPSAHLRPSHHHRRVPGEPPVRPPPFPLRFSRRSAVPGQPSRVTGSRSAGALPSPTWSTWPANVATGPLVSGPGSKDPRYKKSLRLFLISREFQNCCKSCKIHNLFPVNRKNTNDLSKCSEQCSLHFSIKSMHC
jgi:hypothetical protein